MLFHRSKRCQRLLMRLVVLLLLVALAILLVAVCANVVFDAKCNSVTTKHTTTDDALFPSADEQTATAVRLKNTFARGSVRVSVASNASGAVALKQYAISVGWPPE